MSLSDDDIDAAIRRKCALLSQAQDSIHKGAHENLLDLQTARAERLRLHLQAPIQVRHPDHAPHLDLLGH